MGKRIRKMAAALAALVLLAACGAPEEAAEEGQLLAMDTLMTLRVYGQKDALRDAEAELRRLEALLSRTDPGSTLSRLNGSGGETLEGEAELCRLLAAAADWSRETGGTFDITVAPVMDAWGFTGEAQQVPDPEALAGSLSRVGMDRIHIREDGSALQLDPETELDLGGVAKGYAADRLWALFREGGSPRGCASLGGNVLAWGTRPDGEPWRIGIQDPRYPDQQRFVGVLGLEDGFAVTSGSYQRYFEQNGVRYHHILDPKTGFPANSGLVSVTVTAPADPGSASGEPGNGAMCDALSTALFVMGEEEALAYWRQSGGAFQLILVTEDGRVVTTGGLGDRFTPEEGSGYVYETVS